MPYSQVRRSRTVGHKFRWFWCWPVLFSDHLCSGPALHRDGQRVPRTPHIQDRREDLTWSLHQVGVKSRLETLQSGSGTWLEPTFPWSLLRRMGTCWVGGWNDKNDKSENDDNNDNDIIIQRGDDGQPYRALLWAWHAGYLQVSLSLQITFTFFLLFKFTFTFFAFQIHFYFYFLLFKFTFTFIFNFSNSLLLLFFAFQITFSLIFSFSNSLLLLFFTFQIHSQNTDADQATILLPSLGSTLETPMER